MGETGPTFGRRTTRLHLFVSSPGDCSAERTLVEEVVADVNRSAAAEQAAIEIKVLRWENLPPGETQGLDYQGRIGGKPFDGSDGTDINVIIALLDPDLTFHDRAHAWWAQNQSEGWASCPITENGAAVISLVSLAKMNPLP